MESKLIKVLLVEDNSLTQKYAKFFMEGFNCQVDAVSTGKEALSQFHDGYHIILMDLQLSDTDGYEITRRIRAHSDHGKTVPIVALTTNATEQDKQRCYEASMNDMMSKPISLVELERIFAAYVNVNTG